MRIPIQRHVLDVPQRLREIDPDLSVVYNQATKKFDVVGKDLYGPYVLASFDTLDSRVVDSVRRGYFIARNTGAPWKALLREQAELDYLAERDRKKSIQALNEGFRDDMRFAGQSVAPGWRPT